MVNIVACCYVLAPVLLLHLICCFALLVGCFGWWFCLELVLVWPSVGIGFGLKWLPFMVLWILSGLMQCSCPGLCCLWSLILQAMFLVQILLCSNFAIYGSNFALFSSEASQQRASLIGVVDQLVYYFCCIFGSTICWNFAALLG
ncbi:hypothetical protein U1Q18_020288 [Sarracenia purpurea var. burkii]